MAQDVERREPQERRLNGWKEIATYLAKSVRTVQRWERDMELPVRRLEGPKGEIIFAIQSEIDDWRSGRTKKLSATNESDVEEPEVPAASSDLVAPSSTPVRRWSGSRSSTTYLIAACLLIVIASAALWARLSGFAQPQPASVHIDQNALIATDAQGHLVWQHAFPVAMNEAAYSVFGKQMWIGDLNGDGKTEVLFVYHPAAEFPAGSILYCFAADGHELWHFTPGKKVRTATETFDPPYGIQSFKQVKTAKGAYVVVSSAHNTYYPAQLAILSARDGKLVSEYWHSGHLNFVTVGDQDKDGKYEIYASGIDNEYKTATLVVMDLENANGASHQSDSRYQLLDMPIAKERGRVFFPRSCVNRSYFPFNYANLVILHDHGMTVQVNEQGVTPGGSTIEYLLTPDLNLASISPHDSFSANHKMMELQGLLDHAYSESEIQTLANEYRDQASCAKSGAAETGIQHVARSSMPHHVLRHH